MDPIQRLLARDQHGIKFGLENIRTLAAALDHPEQAWTSLIVAGTNGKGSVTAMTAAALTAAGHRTGRYTSPHLVDVEERFAVDGLPVSRDALRAAAARVLDVEARCVEDGSLGAPVTFFEITTATAFELFRAMRVDVVVLEVGMGGRFDATNAADPVCGAITSIALDHQRFLGNTLAEIAFEKAGIIRSGRSIVVGPLPPEADDVVRRVAAERGAHIVDALSDVLFASTLTSDGQTQLRLRTPAHDYGSCRLALRGQHQVANAIVAVRLLEQAPRAGLAIDAAAIVRGLSDVSWPARLEEISLPDGRRVLLDAAHNPAGAATLAQYLIDVGAPPASIIFGAMKDKDVSGMLEVLAPHACRFIFAQAHSHRAMAAEHLEGEARRAGIDLPIVVATTPDEALDRALEHPEPIVVAGSLFLIGDLLPRIGSRASAPCGMLPEGPR